MPTFSWDRVDVNLGMHFFKLSHWQLGQSTAEYAAVRSDTQRSSINLESSVIGVSPSGKAQGFDPCIPRFES